MSLGVIFKGAEGIVLAADSRVTLQASRNQEGLTQIIPAHYDNATKLLQINGQTHVGVVTYGLGALGVAEPRTAYSFLPEFEAELSNDGGGTRRPVDEFAERLSKFFQAQWQALMPADFNGPDMAFMIGGYNEGEPYGKVYEVFIPSRPEPSERHPGSEFGILWGGQSEYVDRIIRGFDERLPAQIQQALNLPNEQTAQLADQLRRAAQLPIPFQFLPLQDCVDLAIFMIRMTISLQHWVVDIRGVGGDINVAIVTRTGGYQSIQSQKITGEASR